MGERKGRLAVCCGLAILLLLYIATGRSQSQSKKAGDDEEQIEPQPLAPPPATPAEKAMRGKIGAFFNTGGKGPALDSDERPFGKPGPATIADPTPRAALPFAEASVVILGRVVDTQPYLSEDKRAVYTEVAVHVDELLKVNSVFNTQEGDVIVLVERGGAARLANGRVVIHPVYGIGTPLRRGGQYVLFLRSADIIPRFFVWTAWELRGSRVVATQVFSFSQQKSELLNMDASRFLETVRAAAR